MASLLVVVRRHAPKHARTRYKPRGELTHARAHFCEQIMHTTRDFCVRVCCCCVPTSRTRTCIIPRHYTLPCTCVWVLLFASIISGRLIWRCILTGGTASAPGGLRVALYTGCRTTYFLPCARSSAGYTGEVGATGIGVCVHVCWGKKRNHHPTPNRATSHPSSVE